MSNLLKADFRRLLKSKGFLILSIITAVSILLSVVGLYLLIMFLISLSPNRENINLRETAYVLEILTKYSSVTSNIVGIAFPILVVTFIASDIKQGTIRNKIIAGYSRTKIYFSSLITSVVVCLVTYIIYTVLIFALSCIFFNIVPQTMYDGYIKNFFISYGYMLIFYVFIVTFVVMFTYVFKNSVGPIMLFMVGIIILQSLGSVAYLLDIQFRGMVDAGYPEYAGAANTMRVLWYVNPFYLMCLPATSNVSSATSSIIGFSAPHNYSVAEYIVLPVVGLFYSLANIGLGVLALNKSNLK